MFQNPPFCSKIFFLFKTFPFLSQKPPFLLCVLDLTFAPFLHLFSGSDVGPVLHKTIGSHKPPLWLRFLALIWLPCFLPFTTGFNQPSITACMVTVFWKLASHAPVELVAPSRSVAVSDMDGIRIRIRAEEYWNKGEHTCCLRATKGRRKDTRRLRSSDQGGTALEQH